MRLFTITAALLAASVTLLANGDYSNRRAPGFSLADSHYQQHDGQDYRGKVFLVDIMSTGCPICIKLVDTLVDIKAKFGDKIGIVSIVTLPDTFDTGDRFAAAHKVTWPILFDSGQMIQSYLKVTPSNPQVHFPHLFIVDQSGWIVNDFDGTEDTNMSSSMISAQIEKLLAKPAR